MTLGEFILESGASPEHVNAIAEQFTIISNSIRQNVPEGAINPDVFRLQAAEGAIIGLLVQLHGITNP